MSRLYWLVLFLVTALAAHAAYVLFAPAQTFDIQLTSILGSKASNRFAVLDDGQAKRIFPAAAGGDIVGICRYDLTFGPLSFEAKLPHGIWSFAVYTISGKQIYTLSDTQAGEDAFTVELARAENVFEQLLGAFMDPTAEAEAVGSAGWKVSVAEARGLAIVWVPLKNELMRQTAVDALKESRCRVKPTNAAT